MTNRSDQNQIVKVVELTTSVARVWQAISDHEQFGEWFRVRLDNPFEVGTLTTGSMTVPGHEGVEWKSVTEQMEHEHLFSFSWHPSAADPDNDYGPDAKVFVEFRLEPIAAGTRLTITETGFEQFIGAKRLEILRSNAEGWDIQAKNITAHVEQ